MLYFCITLKQRSNKRKHNGFLAQLVEQWIENPCVPGSIPGETTSKPLIHFRGFFVLIFIADRFGFPYYLLNQNYNS